MHIDRIYEKYVSETATHVVVENKSSRITLERCRMYNSHLDTRGFLYTDYADREYQQKSASTKGPKVGARHQGLSSRAEELPDAVISEKAKRGWETRRRNKAARGE